MTARIGSFPSSFVVSMVRRPRLSSAPGLLPLERGGDPPATPRASHAGELVLGDPLLARRCEAAPPDGLVADRRATSERSSSASGDSTLSASQAANVRASGRSAPTGMSTTTSASTAYACSARSGRSARLTTSTPVGGRGRRPGGTPVRSSATGSSRDTTTKPCRVRNAREARSSSSARPTRPCAPHRSRACAESRPEQRGPDASAPVQREPPEPSRTARRPGSRPSPSRRRPGSPPSDARRKTVSGRESSSCRSTSTVAPAPGCTTPHRSSTNARSSASVAAGAISMDVI